MRFNSKELVSFIDSNSQDVDKEGIVWIKEKVERMFRKGEVYVERFFQLKGNLFFYRKTKFKTSEVIGLFVLERCMVQLDSEEEKDFGFLLTFENDNKVVKLAAATEQDRDSWIEKLHIASYECLQMQLVSLRGQIQAVTGMDPMEDESIQILQTNPALRTASVSDEDEEPPIFEFSISCTGLPQSVYSPRPPATLAVVETKSGTDQDASWREHTVSEVVESSCTPSYLTSVCLERAEIFGQKTKVKISIWEAVHASPGEEKKSVCVATCTLALQDLLEAQNFMLTAPLRNHGDRAVEVGSIDLIGWLNVELETSQINGTESRDTKTSKLERQMSQKSQGVLRQLEQLRPYCEHLVWMSYVFPTKAGQRLSVYEIMGESKLSFQLPQQLLNLWIEEEKQNLASIEAMGQGAKAHNKHLQYASRYHQETIAQYTDHRSWVQHNKPKGASFKPSSQKAKREVEFVPTNLHLQRLAVQNIHTNAVCFYDTVTCGAFTAYGHKFKAGGMRRLLAKYHEGLQPHARDALELVGELVCALERLRHELQVTYEDFCKAALAADAQGAQESLGKLKNKTRQLRTLCEHERVELSNVALTAAKTDSSHREEDRQTSQVMNDQMTYSPEKSLKWTGSDFVKSPTEEPFDLTRSNVEAALIALEDGVQQVLEGDVQPAMWLNTLSPLVFRFKHCVQVMCSRVHTCLTFQTIQLSGPSMAAYREVKYRRDVVFSHALTTLLSGIMVHLDHHLSYPDFGQQLVSNGLLLGLESLLTCHNDELGMLEDMSVSVGDLAKVMLKVGRVLEGKDRTPIVEGSSLLPDVHPGVSCKSYTVTIPLSDEVYSLLPEELQQGQCIKLVPVLFTMGINEQATMAEKFGDLSLQDEINQTSLKMLVDYYKQYKLDFTSRNRDCSGSSEASDHLQMTEAHLNTLHRILQSRKPKNVEILHIAAQICREMKGVRMICCKSGKDRTSMGVTLEEIQLLQRNHDLADHVEQQALSCLRSDGVRRENARKNVGRPLYSFSSLQLLSFPKVYRPPVGTYGVGQT